MNLTEEEKVEHLDEFECNGGLGVHPDIHDIHKDLANWNGEHQMSCEQFNNAYDLEDLLNRNGLISILAGT